MSEARAEIIAALWRLSRAEAEELRLRIALLERAVSRAMAGGMVGGSDETWQGELAMAESAAAEASARTVRIAALLDGRAA